MTIRHMRILLSILRTGSMAKAAEQMLLSQPALSLAVKELEGYYGVKLFDRIGRGLRPTQEGLRMGQCAQRILELFDGMETSLRDPGAQGQVKVGASITAVSSTHLLLVGLQKFPVVVKPDGHVKLKRFAGKPLKQRLIASFARLFAPLGRGCAARLAPQFLLAGAHLGPPDGVLPHQGYRFGLLGLILL